VARIGVVRALAARMAARRIDFIGRVSHVMTERASAGMS
jgi:hypothetical protein